MEAHFEFEVPVWIKPDQMHLYRDLFLHLATACRDFRPGDQIRATREGLDGGWVIERKGSWEPVL